MAELVDALVSGTSGSNVVGVQVSPSALINELKYDFFHNLLVNSVFFDIIKRYATDEVIVLKISNASDLVASKVGRFLEKITPDGMEEAKVEEEVIKKLVENLRAEGIKGSVASVKGLELSSDGLQLKKELHMRRFEEI